MDREEDVLACAQSRLVRLFDFTRAANMAAEDLAPDLQRPLFARGILDFDPGSRAVRDC
jgi:hypothetical protein